MRENGLKRDAAFRGARIMPAIFSMILILAKIAPAGECPESPEAYVAQLEKLYGDESLRTKLDCFWCLSCYTEDWKRWAGPVAASRFNECRTSIFRERIAAACLPFLHDTAYGARRADPLSAATGKGFIDYRMLAAMLLAFHGYNKLGRHDIFLILTSSWDVHGRAPMQKIIALAALADPRTTSFLSAWYDSLQISERPYYDDYVAAMLNCLYHIPGEEAVELAGRIREREDDSELRERAQRVISR